MPARLVLPSVTLVDLVLGYEVAGLDLRLDVKNAADKVYASWCRGVNPDCGYGEVRRVALTARYRF